MSARRDRRRLEANRQATTNRLKDSAVPRGEDADPTGIMYTYDYRCLNVYMNDSEITLQNWGAVGWRMAANAVDQTVLGQPSGTVFYILERQRVYNPAVESYGRRARKSGPDLKAMLDEHFPMPPRVDPGRIDYSKAQFLKDYQAWLRSPEYPANAPVPPPGVAIDLSTTGNGFRATESEALWFDQHGTSEPSKFYAFTAGDLPPGAERVIDESGTWYRWAPGYSPTDTEREVMAALVGDTSRPQADLEEWGDDALMTVVKNGAMESDRDAARTELARRREGDARE